jgi:hypothetical protein
MAPLELDPVRCRAAWLDEPELQFAEGRLHCDPKTGIPLYGPRSFGTARRKREVHVGFIGTNEAVDHARQFLVKCSEGVAGDKDHAPFPGCTAEQGFRFDLRMDAASVELVSRQEHAELLGIKNSRQRFERTLGLLEEKMRLLSQRDYPPDYIQLVLPHDLYLQCRTAEYVEKGLGRVRLVRAGKRPPLRGTTFHVGDIAYCYTSGYLPFLGRYPHGHVPSPLQVADHMGDTPMPQLLREIMVMTKMNWNSANMAGLMPITLRFSRLVGDILREVPETETPQPNYRYYM